MSVRIAFIGTGSRGTSLLQEALRHPDVQVPALCDTNVENLNRAAEVVERSRGSRPELSPDCRPVLTRDDVDAIVIATPQEDHAAIAVQAMRAGKFAASEVPACTTLDECHELVRAHEEGGSGYMLLENCCYWKHVMQVQRMIEAGLFGELTYARCGYVHDCRSLRFNPDGTLTWRGENTVNYVGDLYPTHGFGPVCQWLGINRSDRLVSLVSMSSKSAAHNVYAAERFGEDHPAAKIEWANGDTTCTLVRTAQGRLIEIRYDTASPRPPAVGPYALQGTKGAYEHAFSEHKVYMEGRSPGHAWEPLDGYEEEFRHPYWRERGDEALKAGHDGGDYFVISDFLDAIRTGVSPIDVYDAVTWSVIRPLSAESILAGGKTVEVPDFKV
jgi:predicted dehydrogenase